MKDDKEGISKDTVMHVVLAAVVFAFATCLLVWPEVQAVLS